MPNLGLRVWIVGAGVVLIYFSIRAVRRPFYLAWMYAVYPIGWTVSHVILAAVFYVVLTPIGLMLRALGRDPIARRVEPSRESYWEPYQPQGEPKRYFKQF